MPRIVLIELGTERSYKVDSINSLKDQTIAYHDEDRLHDMLKVGFSMEGSESYDLFNSAFKHGMARHAHLGALHSLELINHGPVRTGFLPEKLTKSHPGMGEINKRLAFVPDYQKISNEIVAYRNRQARQLTNKGVEKVIFWQPPSIDERKQIKTGNLCLSLMPGCILFDSPSLLMKPVWTDKNHLSHEGAESLSYWLAGKLSKNIDEK